MDGHPSSSKSGNISRKPPLCAPFSILHPHLPPEITTSLQDQESDFRPLSEPVLPRNIIMTIGPLALTQITRKLDQADRLIQAQSIRDTDHPDRRLLALLRSAHQDLLLLISARDETNGGNLTLPTGLIANARDRELSPFSSGLSRPSVPSAASRSSESARMIAVAVADVKPIINQAESCIKAMKDRRPALLPTPSTCDLDDQSSRPTPKATPSKDVSARSIRSLPRRQSRNSSGQFEAKPNILEERETSIVGTSLIREKRNESTGSGSELSESAAQRRRSNRANIRPENYFSFATPGDPSYIPLETTGRSAQARKPKTEQNLALRGAFQLERSDGKIRQINADWPALLARTVEGLRTQVVCEECTAHCHLACAGITVEEASRSDWVCPDCWYLAGVSADRLAVSEIDQGRCIRPDCILLPKRKRKFDKADQEEDDYTLDRIIGRRRAPGWSPANKAFEYLLLWCGTNRDLGRSWGLEDATWEPKSNIFEFRMEENRFIEACKLEGIDARIDTAKPILLREALTHWDEEGELRGDGWSKRKQAEIAQKEAAVKRSHKRGASRTSTSAT